MQYKSPIRLLSAFLNKNEKIEDLDHGFLKKRILAEFELLGKVTIKIEEGELTKNEAINWFESFDEENFKHHLTVYSLPDLLFFLENNQPNGSLDLKSDVFSDAGFASFISPYLANSLGVFYASCIKSQNLMIGLISTQHLPDLLAHKDLMQEPVLKEVEHLIEQIEELQSMFGKAMILPDARVYFTGDIIRILNALPQKYFSVIVDIYAKSGIKLVREFLIKKGSNSVYVERIRFIYKQLQKLSALPETIHELHELEGYLFKQPLEKQEGGSGGARSLAIVTIIIIIIFARFAISDSGSSSRNYEYNNYKIPTFPGSYNKPYLDSIIIEALQHEKLNNKYLSKSSQKMLDSLLKVTEKRMDKLQQSLNDSLKIPLNDCTLTNNRLVDDSLQTEEDEVFLPLPSEEIEDSVKND